MECEDFDEYLSTTREKPLKFIKTLDTTVLLEVISNEFPEHELLLASRKNLTFKISIPIESLEIPLVCFYEESKFQFATRY
jgi:hypothetical protein